MLEPGKIYQVGDIYLQLDNIDIYMDPGSIPDRRFEFHQVYPAVNRSTLEWIDEIATSINDYSTYRSNKLNGWLNDRYASKSGVVNKEEEPVNQDEWIKLLGES